MRIFTIILVCFLPFFSSLLLAKPVLPNFSEPSDTLCMANNPDETGEGILLTNSDPDSSAAKPEKLFAATWLSGCDACGTGIGFIDLTPDINTQGPWLFMWSNGETTEDISGLTSGVYMVTIFDANQQQQQAQIFVAACPFIAPLSITGNVTGNSLCNGASNGAIDLTVNPNPSGWNYFWSSGETTEDLTGIDPGTYTVSVTFGVTCTTTETFIVPNLTSAPTLSPPLGGFGIDFCDTGNGWAGVSAQGGTPPYTYEWSNGGTDVTINDLVTGEYTVTVTGADGCSATLMGLVPAGTLQVTVMENVIVPNTTCIGSNGSISIIVGPPGLWLPSATYLWSNGATTQNLTNLASGSYRVTVTRLGTCTATEVWFIENEPVFPQLSFTNTSASCGFSNGGINLTTLPGGIPPYTYLWSNGLTTEDLTNLLAGTYTVTLTSSNACTSTGSATVDDTPVVFGYSAAVTNQTACDTINGKIVLSLFPTSLSYKWSNGATTTTLNSLAPGDYTVTVSAGGTCTSVETYSVADLREYPSIPIIPDTSTCGLSNGGADLNVLGNAITPLTYLWSNGATTQDLTNILADTFYVTVTSAVGCSNQNFVIVPNFNDTIRILGNVVDNFSCTSPTGNIALNVTPLDTAYTFIWSSGQTTDSLSNLTSGTYLVTVTLGLSCIALDTFDVINNALPPNLASSSTAASCSLNNGAADLTLTGGTGPFTFIWSNSESSEDLINLPPGTYTVTVTGANSCTSVNAVTVLNNNIALNVNGTPVGNTSCAAGNGSVDVGITPAGTYTYLWSNNASTEDLINLTAGSYTVTVSLGSCLSSTSFTITENALPPNLSAAGTAANCGLNDGAADLSVSGGNGPFTFLWSNASTTEDLANLLPGTYTVTVTGANSCSAVSAANVTNNNIALNVNAASLGNTSCTAANGSLDISVAPAGTYTYLWSNANTNEDLSNLSAGAYTVTVTLGTCQSSSTFSVADNTTTPVLTPNITASICGVNNGGIDLSVSGPAGPFTYLWSNMATTEDITSLLPGNYTVTVTAPNGCTEIAMLNVPNNASNFSLAGSPAPLTDCATNNGAIDLNVTPAGAFTYLWSNSATTEDLNSLAPGTYTVSVTQSGSCTATASYFVIDQRTNPITSQSIVPELCGLADGSIDLAISGGTLPYGYLWSNAQTTQDLNNIPAGTYTATITDANNCTTTASAVVPDNSISFALAGNPSPNSSCLQNNGAIDLTINPATPGLIYLWSNMATSEDLNGLNSGTYTVTVSAGGTCTNTAAFTIASNVPTPLLAQNIVAATCGQASGSIDLSVSGSPAPYQYFWSNTSTNEDLNGIVSGNYTVIVTAANGCTGTDNFVVPENVFAPSISSVQTQATSCIANNGAIDLTVAPIMAYSFLWSNAATTEDLMNVAAGNYAVTVSAGGACSSTANLTVGSNTGAVVLSGSPSAILCFGDNNGAIDLTVNSGTAPFVYNWSNANTNEDLTTLLAGAYTVTVTDMLGCSSTSVFTVVQPASALQLQCAATGEVSQIGLTDGSGSVDITGGTGPYTVTWSPGSSQTMVPAGNFSISNLGENIYGVTVTDANGCPLNCGFTVVVASCATAVGTMGNTLVSQCGPGCISAPYNLNGQVLTSNDVLQFVLHQGNAGQIVNEIARAAQPDFCFDPATMSYGVTYYISAVAGGPDPSGNVDLNGNCSVSSPGTPIKFIETPVASSNSPASINCSSTQTALQGTSSLAGSTFAWSTVSGTIVGNPALANTTASAAGAYTLIVATNGCSDTTVVSVTGNFTQPQGTITAQSTTLDCSTNTLALNGSVSGSLNATSVWMSNGTVVGNGNSLMVTAPGQYNFVTMDSLSFCADTSNITVSQNLNPPALSIVAPVVLNCNTNSQTLNGSSTVSGVQFTWATILGADTTVVGSGSMLAVNAPGIYYLFGVNAVNNCANSTAVTVIADLAPPTADAGAPFTLDCAGETAGLDGSGAGAPGLSYGWTTPDGNFVSGATTATPLIDESGTYLLTVTNPSNGCTDTDEVIIASEVPVAFASVVQPSCMDLQGTVQIDSVTGLSAPILYSLNNGPPSAQNQFTNLVAGTYNIEVLGGNGCSAMAVAVVMAAPLVEITLVPQVTINLGYSYQIDATVNIPNADIASVTWTPATGLLCDTCLSTEATPLTTTDYQIVVVSKAGCEARGNLLLTVDKTRKVYGPNIFSPNEDGTNDAFTIFADPFTVVSVKSLQVFSRWGEAVYERRDFAPGDDIGWDGTFKGQRLNPAVFVWQAVVLFVDGKEELFTGDVTLQR